PTLLASPTPRLLPRWSCLPRNKGPAVLGICRADDSSLRRVRATDLATTDPAVRSLVSRPLRHLPEPAEQRSGPWPGPPYDKQLGIASWRRPRGAGLIPPFGPVSEKWPGTHPPRHGHPQALDGRRPEQLDRGVRPGLRMRLPR